MGKWYLYCKKADFAEISKKFNISPMLARIIRNRDIEGDDLVSKFLYSGMDSLYDPYLLKGMEAAVDIILKAISDNKKIRIMGDYDVDGVCSSHIIKTYLQAAGADADIRLPDRVLEGYGMNEHMVNEAIADGINLIITCDNGVSSYEGIALARRNGLDVIVTDHHEVPYPLVDANVIIDAKQDDDTYTFKELCGGGIALKLVMAIDMKLKNPQCKKILDGLVMFAGLATIADIVPLVDENRILAKEGLKKLKVTENIGLKTLIEIKNIERNVISEFHIGFIIGPCINSAGRLKNASIALGLLEADSETKAKKIAQELSELNDLRKDLTARQYDEAISIIEKNQIYKNKIIVVFLENAHESVAGIIAGRIKDTYSRPVIVITKSENGLKGSGRSIKAYNMIKSISCFPGLFQKYGGHAMAVGFSLMEGVLPEELSKKLNENCHLEEDELFEKTWIDMQLPFKYVTSDFVEELKILEPFGMGNEKPVFAGKNIDVLSYSTPGKKNNVIKLSLKDEEGVIIDGIFFGSEEKVAEILDELKEADIINSGKKISILFYPEINEFRGFKNPQVKITDFLIN